MYTCSYDPYTPVLNPRVLLVVLFYGDITSSFEDAIICTSESMDVVRMMLSPVQMELCIIICNKFRSRCWFQLLLTRCSVLTEYGVDGMSSR